MSGKGASTGTATTATGVAVLPNTGDNRLLFAIAIGLLVSGVIIFVTSTVAARKKNQSEAN